MIRKILQVPHRDLRLPSTDVPPGWVEGESIQELFADLLDTMHQHHALGLSAIQIGVPFRVFAISDRTDCPWQIMMNPRIVDRYGARIVGEEGCMSIDMGRMAFRVERDQKIQVIFLNRKGDEIVWNASGLAARVIQHEFDHLDGVLIDSVLPASRIQGWNSPAVDALPGQAAG